MCVHGLNVGVIARGTAGGREPVVLFFAIRVFAKVRFSKYTFLKIVPKAAFAVHF